MEEPVPGVCIDSKALCQDLLGHFPKIRYFAITLKKAFKNLKDRNAVCEILLSIDSPLGRTLRRDGANDECLVKASMTRTGDGLRILFEEDDERHWQIQRHPFPTCRVKCGAGALQMLQTVQNAHGMTLAARAIVELFSYRGA